MKNLPGIKITGFVVLALAVAVGVYAATHHEPEPSPVQPNVIVKFGISEPIEKLSVERALKIIGRFQKDENLYVIEHVEDGTVDKTYGHLQTCSEPLSATVSAAASPTPAPTPSPSPAPTRSPVTGTGPTPSATATGTKTQTRGAVALTIGRSQEFFQALNEGMRAEHKAGKAEKKSKNE